VRCSIPPGGACPLAGIETIPDAAKTRLQHLTYPTSAIDLMRSDHGRSAAGAYGARSQTFFLVSLNMRRHRS
jgi:hypothetical protein